MAVARYAWTCPGCGRQFAVRDGLAPALCPDCQAATGPVPAEAPPEPGDIILHTGRPPVPAGAGPRARPTLLQSAFDPGFERCVTPWIIRVMWLVALLSAGTAIIVGTARLATGGWSPGPPPASLSAGLWNFLVWLSLVAGAVLATLAVRVLCEVASVLFRIARSLDALRRAAEDRARERDE
jgi:hypothetical protein